MTATPTRAQLKNGAQGIAYRAEHLAELAALFHSGLPIRVPDARVVKTIRNALIESALVNARALAWFFTQTSDVNTSMLRSKWEDDVVTVAGKVIGPVSQHLSHATTGSKTGEKHPGEWPISELAVVLVGGLARFVQALDGSSETYELSWFTPSPVDTYRDLMALNPLSSPTRVSDNPSVGGLTRALHQHLRATISGPPSTSGNI
jgi:hypothetical protein